MTGDLRVFAPGQWRRKVSSVLQRIHARMTSCSAGLEPALAARDQMFIQSIHSQSRHLEISPRPDRACARSAQYRSVESAEGAPLAAALLSLPGVQSVMFGQDFVSVTKGEVDWAHLKPALLGIIMEHFTSQAPLLVGEAAPRRGRKFFDPRRRRGSRDDQGVDRNPR